MASWERFKQIVKHERRYTFWSVNNSEVSVAETTPNAMLTLIGEAIHIVGLTKVLSPGARFWRVRVHKRDEVLSSASDFSAPPVKMAVYPNRMSPAGVPMFYGANDFDTAVLETVDPADTKGKRVTGVAFQNLVPLNILD